jgi:Glycerophosphoryl diester phosphodiesterase family
MRDKRFFALAVLLMIAVGLASGRTQADDATPLARAHAHNDYLHERPLADALDHGFTSVEADVFLVDGRLLVAHTQREIKPDRTLEALYLDPLRKRVAAGGGSVYAGGGAFHLLVDLKTAGEPTYAALAKVLADYADMISVVRDGRIEPKAVNVSISGNRPIQTISNESVRYAGIDGRLGDLDSDAPVHLMPLLSDNWSLYFRWRGKGPMSDAERKKLHDIVAKTHARGRRIRFWATPDNVEMWRELDAAGVDMINTDDLAGLEKFLRSRPPAN